jgi:hypothetical protein
MIPMEVQPYHTNRLARLVLSGGTLGLVNLLTWVVRNGWSRRMDDDGLTTRRGTRF